MKVIYPDAIIGIIGGGQLGRMTALAAANMGYRVHIFTPEENSPASFISYKTTVAPYDDKASLQKFAQSVDVISFEFENIPHDTMSYLEEFCNVYPRWQVLHTAQNRAREKNFFNSIDVATVDFVHIKNANDLAGAMEKLDAEKAVFKSAEFGYDGKGQIIVTRADDLEAAWNEINKSEAVLEKFIPFEKEISVIIARNANAQSAVFPPSENIHVNGILDTSIVPAEISPETSSQAVSIAHKIADNLGLVGILAIEFFVKSDGSLLVNEIAPRPHNSGHWTMDGCKTSQFEQFIRAICGLSFGSTDAHSKVTMKNLIGNDVDNLAEILKNPTAKLHLYGKKEARNGRKMGHVNYL